MKIVALMTVRNEGSCLDRCLRHLREQGVETCFIDNDSTDGSAAIARKYLGNGVLRIERLPFRGFFDLTETLENEERLSREIKADWFLHHDADELRNAPLPHHSLAEGFAEADRLGFNAVHFDEFVFAPSEDSESHAPESFPETMRRYYFFEPAPLRRLNAWKNFGQRADLSSSGGHRVQFDGIRIFSKPFILRHYIGLSRRHLAEKYGTRRFAERDLQKGWHAERARFRADSFRLPDAARLKTADTSGVWDKSDPWTAHPFLSP